MSSTQLATEPMAVRLSEAIRISGFSRSEIYRRAARPAGDPGRVIFRKSGSSTLVDVASLRSAIEALPVATIGAGKMRKHGDERQGEAA
jgi:hypothetical protein